MPDQVPTVEQYGAGVRALERDRPEVIYRFTPLELLTLIGLLQLTTRHPNLPPTTRSAALGLIQRFSSLVSGVSWAVDQVIRAGNNPALDEPIDDAPPIVRPS